jgi:hypothetical protein
MNDLDHQQLEQLERLLAERTIRQLLLSYCRGIDRCEAERVASVYHDDATDDHGTYKGLGVEFGTYATERLREHAEATMHFLGDSIFDWINADTVRVETYVEAVHRCTDAIGPVLERFGGRYVDRIERRNGEWKIADRVCVREWDGKDRLEPWFPPGRFSEGRRNRTDLCYGP